MSTTTDHRVRNPQLREWARRNGFFSDEEVKIGILRQLCVITTWNAIQTGILLAVLVAVVFK